jgi:uncharacterized LabA/DUF88 family protein
LRQQRVVVLIDVMNVFIAAQQVGRKVDYIKLVNLLVKERALVHARAYLIRSNKSRRGNDKTPIDQRFVDILRDNGIEVMEKDIQYFPGGVSKGDWDVGITVDAISMADSYDTLVLVTGDGDFIPLLNFIRYGCGRRVEVTAFRQCASAKLVEKAELFTDLSKLNDIFVTPVSRVVTAGGGTVAVNQ